MPSSGKLQHFSVEVPNDFELIFPPDSEYLELRDWFGAVLRCGRENVRECQLCRTDGLGKFSWKHLLSLSMKGKLFPFIRTQHAYNHLVLASTRLGCGTYCQPHTKLLLPEMQIRQTM